MKFTSTTTALTAAVGSGAGRAAADAGIPRQQWSPAASPDTGQSRAAAPVPGRRFVLVGVQGGVGVSTLAWLLAPAAVDLGVARDWRRLANPGGHPVVLVSGCTVASTGRAVAEVAAAAWAGVVPRALLVVQDGWPVPADARARLGLLAARVGAVVPVPYVPAWRYVDQPDPARLPSTVVRALALVRAAVDGVVQR